MNLSTRLAISLFLLMSADADLGGNNDDTKSTKSTKSTSSSSSSSKSSRRRTRSLLAPKSISLKPEDPYFQEVVSRCAEYEYDASIYVDTHVFGVASPRKEAIAALCPFVVTHAVLSREPTVRVSKEILIWDTKEKAKRFKTEGFYQVGILQFSDIARAIDQAKPTRADAPLFDVWHNNCADYIINLGSELGLKADAKVTSFVVRRLLENYSNDWVEKVRYKMNYFSIFEGRRLGEKGISNEDVIQLLVESRTSELY